MHLFLQVLFILGFYECNLTPLLISYVVFAPISLTSPQAQRQREEGGRGVMPRRGGERHKRRIYHEKLPNE